MNLRGRKKVNIDHSELTTTTTSSQQNKTSFDPSTVQNESNLFKSDNNSKNVNFFDYSLSN
jgi:hypothetical protein